MTPLPAAPALAPEPTPAEREALARYEAARDWIDVALVRPGKRPRDPEGKVRAARAFFAALGDPQRAWPAVQVAGTSGKGSVAHLLALALRRAGVRAGLHVSPYLQAFTEKVVVDGRYCDPLAFARATDRARPAIAALADDPPLPASVHGLAALAATYLAFQEARLDLGVIESGVGGRFDLVQGLDRALSVITDLGLDHQDVLGETLEEIAWHKAGIMQRGVPCVAVQGAGWPVLEAEARAVGAPLVPVRVEERLRPVDAARWLLRLDHLGDVEVAPPRVPWHARNAAVAAVALDALAARGWPVRAEDVARAVDGLRHPGRYEVVQGGVVLDGAHNAPKLEALRAALEADLGPAPGAVVVFATTGPRDPRALLSALAPAARAVVCTAPALFGKDAVAPAALADVARGLGLEARAVDGPLAALDDALEQARREGRPVVVTGSLYLVGQVRERWFPWRQVVLQGTSWPA